MNGRDDIPTQKTDDSHTQNELFLLPCPRSINLSDLPMNGPAHVISVMRIEDKTIPPQGYRVRMEAEGIRIEAADDAGEFYARKTIDQISAQCKDRLFQGTIEDWPDFPVRGVMLDISRDKVPSIQTLFRLVDELSSWKINRLELYTEHTFAYRNHKIVWQDADPMTGDEIRELDQYCRARHVDLVPNQNSFGHFERWLKHTRYRDMAECPDGFTYPWKTFSTVGSTLDPGNPRSIELIAGLYEELLPNFTSRNINVGCDETWELGQGRSKANCEARGKGRVYLEFLLKIYELTKKHGRIMHFWGDIILHHPELIPDLPRDVTALAWGYEADHPFADQAAKFAASGIPFFVCPGTSSWNSISGRTNNCLANMLNAAENGIKYHAHGFMITDWGDGGHWQYLPVSYPGLAAGAGLSWCVQSNRSLSLDRRVLCEAMNRLVYRDKAGVMGGIAYDLGNTYSQAGSTTANGTSLFKAMSRNLADCAVDKKQYKPWLLLAARDYARATASAVRNSRMTRDDAHIIRAEFLNAGAMLIHACNRALMALGEQTAPDRSVMLEDIQRIMKEHGRLWLARNRPGGLKDSLARMESRSDEYEVFNERTVQFNEQKIPKPRSRQRGSANKTNRSVRLSARKKDGK